MAGEVRYWLWVFGDVAGLRWVVEHETMAFSDSAAPRARPMGRGDRAVLHVARGAFRNPTRDRARLGGVVTVLDEPRRRRRPLRIAGREFAVTVPIRIDQLLPERAGPEVQPLARKLSFVERPEVWGVYFHTSPKRIPKRDFDLLAREARRWEARRER